MPLTLVHPIQILVGAVGALALGSFWYSSLGFGKIWIKALGASQSDIDAAKKKGMQAAFAAAFANSLVAMYVLNLFINILGVVTPLTGMTVGALLGLGFCATAQLGDVLWEGKKPRVWLITSGYYIVLYAAVGALFAVWS